MRARFFLFRLARAGGLALLTLLLLLAAWPKPQLIGDLAFSSCYADRQGKLLRLSLAEDEAYRVYVPLEKISPQLVEMTLLHEDRYFHEHPGFNPVSLARATWSFLSGWGPHIGASTITMQLARLHYHLPTRTVPGKIAQIVVALYLEIHCSKHDILEAYLNSAPYGRNIEGVGAASLIYFKKEPAQLSANEALTLAVIPQSPARRAPGRHGGEAALRQARELLLSQWLTAHPGDARLKEVLAMPLQISLPRDLPFRAPHLVNELMLSGTPPRAEVRLALDGDLQDFLERAVAAYLAPREPLGLKNACALLLDYPTMEVRAAVGSAGYGRKDIQGQVNGLHMQRSPGSALKPFIYALALDEGLIHPNSLLKDAPISFNGYDPENFDHEFAGPIRARDALIQSRNIPAVDLEARLDPQRNLYTLLQETGVRRLQPQEHYGLTVALGSAEVSPEEMAMLYALLANRGRLQPLRFTLGPVPPGVAASAPAPPLLSPEAAWLTLDMLKDAVPPGNIDFTAADLAARPVAWKTGTSYSYRDAWTGGVFDRYVLVVWVGNFDGQPNPAFIGRSAAAPLFFSIVNGLRAREAGTDAPAFTLTPDLNLKQVALCAVSGALAGPNCPQITRGWFIPGVSPIAPCTVHRRVWLDNATGRRLSGPSDDPATSHSVVCEFWSSDLARLFRLAGLPRRLPPPLLASTETSASAAASLENGPRITSPKPGLTYHIRLSARGADVLNLEATTETGNDCLHWFVDTTYLGASPPSSSFLWKLQPGQHTIRAVDDLGRADTREITVTTVE